MKTDKVTELNELLLKRIAATLSLWFLQNNGILYRPDGIKRIADGTLVALTLLIAESRMDFLVKMVVNLINRKPTLEEFCQIYPELLAQAREYAEGTIVDPEEYDDAVDSCICDFMAGVRAAMFYKAELPVRS